MSESSAGPGKSAGVGAQPEFAAWRTLGMLIQLGVTDPAKLAPARQMLADDLAALDLACSRFRPDSELVAVGTAARGAPGPVTLPVGPLLAEAVEVSLRAAEL
jgi:FAD:protein FMN transferase